MTARDVAAEVLQGRMSAKWVIEHMASDIGRKPGRAWLFYEKDARDWWDQFWRKGS